MHTLTQNYSNSIEKYRSPSTAAIHTLAPFYDKKKIHTNNFKAFQNARSPIKSPTSISLRCSTRHLRQLSKGYSTPPEILITYEKWRCSLKSKSLTIFGFDIESFQASPSQLRLCAIRIVWIMGSDIFDCNGVTIDFVCFD